MPNTAAKHMNTIYCWWYCKAFIISNRVNIQLCKIRILFLPDLYFVYLPPAYHLDLSCFSKGDLSLMHF